MTEISISTLNYSNIPSRLQVTSYYREHLVFWIVFLKRNYINQINSCNTIG